MVERLFLAVPRGCLQFVIVVFPDHTHLLFLKQDHTENVYDADKVSELTWMTHSTNSGPEVE